MSRVVQQPTGQYADLIDQPFQVRTCLKKRISTELPVRDVAEAGGCASARYVVPQEMLGQGFEPWSSAVFRTGTARYRVRRKANMIGRTTPTERVLPLRRGRFNSSQLPSLGHPFTRRRVPAADPKRSTDRPRIANDHIYPASNLCIRTETISNPRIWHHYRHILAHGATLGTKDVYIF